MTVTAGSFSDTLNAVDSFVWGPWLLIPLLLGTGIVLTIRLRGLQFRKLGAALRFAFFQRDRAGRQVARLAIFRTIRR
jgi:AGCS family alanine or glycine:cation symporter